MIGTGKQIYDLCKKISYQEKKGRCLNRWTATIRKGLAKDFSWMVTIYKDAHLLKGLEMKVSKNVKIQKQNKKRNKKKFTLLFRALLFLSSSRLLFWIVLLKSSSNRSLTVNCDTAVVNSEQSQYSMLSMHRTVRLLEPYCPSIHYDFSWWIRFKTRQYGLKNYYFSRFVNNGKREMD